MEIPSEKCADVFVCVSVFARGYKQNTIGLGRLDVW